MENTSQILLASSINDYFVGIANHLNKMGCTVTSVCHARELESVYAEKPFFSLVLLSTDLPGLESLDFVVRGRRLFPDTPFFLFMSDISLHSLRLAEFLHLNEVIRNPVAMADLEQLINKYLKIYS